MVNISKVDDSTIKFTFTDNDRYLYNGEISLPLNSLILELDASDMVIFKKIDGDVFVTFLISNSNFDTKEDLEEFYATSMVGSTGGGGGITSGEVQTMIDESISGKQDTLSAGTGIEISGNVISATGGGATYSAGLGIEIDSADTITAIYEGYPQVDEEAKTNRLSNTTDPFYVMSTNAASASGATRFKFDSKNRIATYDFAQHTATIDGEEWPDYLTWQWSDSYNMFLITPLQSIPSATANTFNSGTTFVMPSGVTLVNSGKTTSVITDLTKKADNAIVDIAVGIDNNGFTYGYYKPGDTLPHWAAMVGIKGGLAKDKNQGSLTTKVLKSLVEHWYDIDTSSVTGWDISIEPTTSVQFDLASGLQDKQIWVTTNVFGEEQILDENGDILTDLSGVTVTKESDHVIVTAIDNPYAETPYRIIALGTTSSISTDIANLQAYGYEYTTIDNAVETILSGKQDTLSAGTGIEISGNVISATGGGGGIDSGTVQTMIDDSISGKADTSAVTESINAAVSGKVDTTDFATYSGTVETALSGKQDTLSAGTGIEISGNVISATGGGATYSAGTNISISTANTISCTLPITASTSVRKYDIAIGNDIINSSSDYKRVAIGNGNKFKYSSTRTEESILIGTPSNTTATYNVVNGTKCIGIGGGGLEVGYDNYTGVGSIAIGYGTKSLINKSLAIGYQAVASGTTQTNINNQLKIDTSNQIYIKDKTNTNEICLQDYLGGTVSSAITSGDTNAVAGGAVYDKFDEVESVTARALIDVNEKFGGLKLVKLSQAQYDALSGSTDSNTLYVIV